MPVLSEHRALITPLWHCSPVAARRENDVVVKASGWGATAYLRLDSINTLPHFNPEARVTTPFGRGTVGSGDGDDDVGRRKGYFCCA